MTVKMTAHGVSLEMTDATAEEAQMFERLADHMRFASSMPVVVSVPDEMVTQVNVPAPNSNGVIVVPASAQFLQFPPTE